VKVYIVTAFTAEEWENHSWIHSVYSTREKAEASIKEVGMGVQEEDQADFLSGWFLSQNCEEWGVE